MTVRVSSVLYVLLVKQAQVHYGIRLRLSRKHKLVAFVDTLSHSQAQPKRALGRVHAPGGTPATPQKARAAALNLDRKHLFFCLSDRFSDK
mgnify:CR=1 FL=1